MITVFIVDDHPFVREGLKVFLKTQSDLAVVGEAGDGEAALKSILQLQPDVAVVDLNLPRLDGIALTRGIREAGLFTKVIILSSFCDDREVIAAIEAGALSYLLKDSPPQKLAEAILAAAEGVSVLHPRITQKLMQRVKRNEPVGEVLTQKEKEVLAQLVNGKSNKEIAAELIISETTVKTHVSNIIHKLQVNDRTQAVIKTIRENLL